MSPGKPSSASGAVPRPLPRQPRRAVAELAAADPVMARAIAEVGRFALPQRPADLRMLCVSVIGQSISIHAAARIVCRFHDTVGGGCEVRPAAVLARSEEELMALGLTRTKAGAVRALAELWRRERWTPEALARLPDEAVAEALTAVRGVGPWTAKMFLIFGLRRPDVLPYEDLGLREALVQLYGLPQRPGREEVERLAECWRPWRTVATVYAWQALLRRRGATLSGGDGWW